MKTSILSLLFTALFFNGFTQNLNFSVHGNYAHPITKEKLVNARSMGDLIPYYPSNWIDSYNSAQISVVSDGKTETASSSSGILSEEQVKMLGSLDFGDEIAINIGYQRKNTVTNETETGTMHYAATVIPETEAKFSEGNDKLTQYIKGAVKDKISVEESNDLEQAVIRFTINEKGEIADAHIFKSSGNNGIDQLLLFVVNKMPDWQPATDSRGNKVRQEFELTVSGGSEGC